MKYTPTLLEDSWEKTPHPVFGEGGSEPASETEKLINQNGMFPRIQWRKGIFSIIEPCGITFGQYELHPMDGDVMRFDTLEEAKEYADAIFSPEKEI